MEYIEVKTNEDKKLTTASYENIDVSFQEHVTYEYSNEKKYKRYNYLTMEICERDEDGDTQSQIMTFYKGTVEEHKRSIGNLIKALEEAKKLNHGKLIKGYVGLLSPFAFSIQITFGYRKLYGKSYIQVWDYFQKFSLHLFFAHIEVTIPWKSLFYFLKGNLVKGNTGWYNKKYNEEK